MISRSMQMRTDSPPLSVCMLMMIGHGREQRPDAVGEIAHFEYWNQTVSTARRRRHYFTFCRGRKGGTRGMTEEKQKVLLAFLDNSMRECFDCMVALVFVRESERGRDQPQKAWKIPPYRHTNISH